jgi:hypothetical protein
MPYSTYLTRNLVLLLLVFPRWICYDCALVCAVCPTVWFKISGHPDFDDELMMMMMMMHELARLARLISTACENDHTSFIVL